MVLSVGLNNSHGQGIDATAKHDIYISQAIPGCWLSCGSGIDTWLGRAETADNWTDEGSAGEVSWVTHPQTARVAKRGDQKASDGIWMHTWWLSVLVGEDKLSKTPRLSCVRLRERQCRDSLCHQRVPQFCTGPTKGGE